MTKIQAMRAALSETAIEKLGHSRFDRIGAPVQIFDLAVMTELRVHGVVGPNDGLTVVGAALAGRLQAEVFDKAF